jgi:hypothetical protein
VHDVARLRQRLEHPPGIVAVGGSPSHQAQRTGEQPRGATVTLYDNVP